MTIKERLVKSNSIWRRQKAGYITIGQASAEFDELCSDATGVLVYWGNSTNMTAAWNPDVMIVPRIDKQPSNTGIVVRGFDRGLVLTKPGEIRDCVEEVLTYLLQGEVQHPEVTP